MKCYNRFIGKLAAFERLFVLMRMRLTYTDIKSHFGDNIGQPGFTDSTLGSFFDRTLSQRYQLILAELSNHKTQPPPQTATTVEDQKYYHYPPGVFNIEAMTVTVGSEPVPVTVVNSQLEGDRLNQLPLTTSVPVHFFPRRDDFGIWPIPDDAYTLTLNYHLRDRRNVSMEMRQVGLEFRQPLVVENLPGWGWMEASTWVG